MTLSKQHPDISPAGNLPAVRSGLSLSIGVAWVFMFTAFIASALTIIILVYALRNQMIETFQQRLIDVATLASQRIDGDLHSRLVEPAQENTPEYNQIKQALIDVRNVNPDDYRFVYTLRLVQGQVEFVVDAETNPKDISHLGDNYSDISPVLLQNISTATGPFADQEFYTDQWGTFLSGYAPILTSSGRVDGFVGVDISAATFQAAERRIFLIAGLVFLAIIPLIGLAGYRFGQWMTAPILMLIRSTERLASGDLKHRIYYEGLDELNRLVGTVNKLVDNMSGTVSRLEETVTTHTKESEQRFEYLQTAADVGAAVGAILDPNRLITEVTNLIQTRFSLYYVGLFLVDETGEWAVLRAATGEAGEKMLMRGHRIRVGEGMVGWSISNNQARVALQAERDVVRLRIPELPLTQSEAAIPLRSRDRILGALSVQSEQPNAFDRTSLFVLQMLADQVAVALDNARLLSLRQAELDDIQRSYQQLTQSAWDTILRSRGELGYSADEEGLSPISQVDLAQVSRGISEDGFTLALPIRVRGQVLGYLQAARPAAAQPWTDEDMALANNLLDQLSVALDNARLYSATQRIAERERILSTITGRVRSSTSVDAILQTAVRQLAEALKVPRGSIRLLSGSQAEEDVKVSSD